MRKYEDFLDWPRNKSVPKLDSQTAGGGNIHLDNAPAPRATLDGGPCRGLSFQVEPTAGDYKKAVLLGANGILGIASPY